MRLKKILRAVLFAAVLGLLAGCLSGCDRTPDYSTPRAAVVQLFDKGHENSSCSGVMIAPMTMLTAAHCFGDEGKDVMEATPERLQLTIVKRDTVSDLALVRVPLACPCVPVAANPPDMDQALVMVGYPANNLVVLQVATEGRAQGVGPVRAKPGTLLRLTAPTASGNSGGGVFAKNWGMWELVGISTMVAKPCDDEGCRSVPHLAFAADTKAIQTFLNPPPSRLRKSPWRHAAPS